jgi:hypothetical protein
MPHDAPDLHALLSQLAQQDDNRLVVRWTDEQRIQPNAQGGFTIGRVARATLTARVADKLTQLTVEGMSLAELQQILRGYDVDPLFRADNITR